MSLLDKIKGKREEIKLNRASQTRAYKFKPGKTVISLLPLHDDLAKPAADQGIWREFGMHFIKNRKGEQVVTVGDKSICFPGEICPVREGLVDLIRHANAIGDEDLAKYAKESLGKKNYLLNIMVHQDPDMKKEENPVLASFSENLFDSLGSVLEEYLAEGGDDATRFKDRLMFVVERTGTTKNDTRYTIMPAAKRMTIDPSVMSKATNLEEYVQGQFSDSVTKALAYLSTALGRSLTGSDFAAALTAAPGAKPAAASLAAPASAAEAEDLLGGTVVTPARTTSAPALEKSRAVDAEFVEVEKPAAPAAPTAAETNLLDEIDNLAA